MWKITRVNPATRKVTLLNHKGKTLHVEIPEHHNTREQKFAHIKHHTDRHDNRSKNIKRILILAAVVHVCIGAVALYLKLKG